MKILLFTDYPHSAQHSVVDQMTIIVDYVSIILPPHSTPAELFIVSSISHITRVNHTSPCHSNSLIAARSHCTLSHHIIPLACKVFSIFISVDVLRLRCWCDCGFIIWYQLWSETLWEPTTCQLGRLMPSNIFKNIIYF